MRLSVRAWFVKKCFLGRQLCKEMFLAGNPNQALAKGQERISPIVSELCQGTTFQSCRNKAWQKTGALARRQNNA